MSVTARVTTLLFLFHSNPFRHKASKSDAIATLISHAGRPAAGGATNFMQFAVNKHQPLTSRTWQPSPDAEGAMVEALDR